MHGPSPPNLGYPKTKKRLIITGQPPVGKWLATELFSVPSVDALVDAAVEHVVRVEHFASDHVLVVPEHHTRQAAAVVSLQLHHAVVGRLVAGAGTAHEVPVGVVLVVGRVLLDPVNRISTNRRRSQGSQAVRGDRIHAVPSNVPSGIWRLFEPST